jgi:hypothetical protein
MPRNRDRRKARRHAWGFFRATASQSSFTKRGAKNFNGRAAYFVNNSRFFCNDHKARHGHASLATGLVLFKL